MRRVDWAALGAVLARLKPFFAAEASLLTFVLIALLAARWSIFLRQQSVVIPFSKVLSLTWAGQFFNSVLPGSTGGDFVKIYQLCRMMPGKKGAATLTVIIDRFSALVALAVLVAFAIAAGPARKLGAVGLSAGPIWFWIVAGMALGAVVGFIGRRMLRSLKWQTRWRSLLKLLRTSFTLNWNLAAAVTLAFVTHLVNFALFFLFARALGIGISFYQTLLIMPVVLLLVMLPVTINGHGLREVLLIFFFTQLQISLPGSSGIGIKETVIGLSVVGVTNDLLWSLPGGLWYLLRFRIPARQTADLPPPGSVTRN